MIKMQNCAVGETPTFAAILAENASLNDVLFEAWEPADSKAFAEEFFPPFRWDGEEEGVDPERTVESVVEEPEYFGGNVHVLQNRPVKTA